MTLYSIVEQPRVKFAARQRPCWALACQQSSQRALPWLAIGCGVEGAAASTTVEHGRRSPTAALATPHEDIERA
jgi:hypothetical protein